MRVLGFYEEILDRKSGKMVPGLGFSSEDQVALDYIKTTVIEQKVVKVQGQVEAEQYFNYPGLAKWINLERFASGKVKGRKYRNRRIGELFKEIDLSEKKGTGIPKILRELKQNGSPEPEFDMDEERTYLNAIIRIRDGFERKEKMSESMSELERARMCASISLRSASVILKMMVGFLCLLLIAMLLLHGFFKLKL